MTKHTGFLDRHFREYLLYQVFFSSKLDSPVGSLNMGFLEMKLEKQREELIEFSSSLFKEKKKMYEW